MAFLGHFWPWFPQSYCLQEQPKGYCRYLFGHILSIFQRNDYGKTIWVLKTCHGHQKMVIYPLNVEWVFHVTGVIAEMTCKRSVKTITRNHAVPISNVGSCSNTGKSNTGNTGKSLISSNIFIFELLSLPESFQKAVILPQTIASQKNLSARLPEERPISTFHMKQLEYFENVQRIILRPQKVFHERYSKEKMIHRSK